MKKKILNLILTTVCISMIAFPNTAFATENTDASKEVSIEENIDKDKEEKIEKEDKAAAEESKEVVEETDESSESTSASSIDTSNIFKETNNENSAIYVDGKKIDKNVWITIESKSDGKTSLTKGTKFIVTFESTTLNNYRKEVTLDLNHNFGAEVELPADEYSISSYSVIGKEPSTARLIIDGGETVMMFTENTTIKFTLEGDIKTDTIDEEPVIEEKKEVKETNFWLDLLKNNILFIVLLLGSGAFLLIYKMRQDAE